MNPGCRKCQFNFQSRGECSRTVDGGCGHKAAYVAAMEVKPSRAGTFVVSLFQHTPERLFIHEVTLSTDGSTWDYKEYAGQCYVCFIHSKVEEPKQ